MATPDVAAARPLRRDAERNRHLVLAAAGEVFAEQGLDASMEAVARRAGVGVGTVYRRFPDRDALIDALFQERMLEMVAVVEDALKEPDPWRGLERGIAGMIERQVRDRGLKELMTVRGRGADGLREKRLRLVPAVERLVARAVEDGSLRDDVTATDFALIQRMLSAVVDLGGELEPDLWRRSLGLVLDGLRARRDAPTSLPTEPLDATRLEAAMRALGCAGEPAS